MDFLAIFVDMLSVVLLVIGSFFSVMGGVGLVRLPEFFSRMHGAGITDTIGAGMIMIALMLQAGFTLTMVKLLMILFFLLITCPSSSHALAKAAMTHGMKPVLDKKKYQAGRSER